MEDLGVMLRVVKSNLTPKAIINKHYEVEQEKGKVAWSSDIIFDRKKYKELNKIVFFFKDEDGIKYVLADIEDAICKSKKEKFIPEEYYEYIPDIYVNQPKSSWFILKNFQPVSEKDLENYRYVSDEKIKVTDFTKKVRFTKVYFYEINLNSKKLF